MKIIPFLFLLLTISGFSQQAVPASGGTVSGASGSFSVSVGQAVSGYLQNATHSVSQGVQQTYAIYATQVQAAQCSTVVANLDTAIIADAIVGAQKYRFEVTNGSNISNIELVTNSFTLAQLSGGACFNTAYAIRVAVQYGSVWYDYGTSCTITTPNIAPTASAQTLCASATVANLIATGTLIKWYAAATGGTALAITNILTTGTYYASQTVNGCESARTTVTVTITQNTTPTFTQVSTVCSGTTVTSLPTTSTNGITGTWSPALNNTATTTYTFTPTVGQCATTTTQTITITNPFITSPISFTAPVASIGALNVGSATITGTLTNGIAASGVSASIPYTGGNGISYATQTVSSTGVSGLTATLLSGVLANGAGSLLYTISGTPTASGTASFAITIGGKSGVFTVPVAVNYTSQYPTGSIFCSGATAIVDVTNPTTGKIWMDRNLGATRVATSATDSAAYGDLYQWGRRTDGHQCRNSATTSILSSVDQPSISNHIIVPNSPFDWRSPQNTNLWQGVNGVNNPCPSGYRLPTETELNSERLSWSSNNSAGAFASPLKLTMAGGRHYNNDFSLVNVGTLGDYYSSTINGTNSRNLVFENGNAYMNSDFRADGDSVRCIKDASVIPATVGALNCGSTSVTGTLTNGTAASSVSAAVPYTGGNGGSYLAQSISSTGVAGLTATLTSGILANGAGSFSFAISGTPSESGTASFTLTLGGQSCSFTIFVQSALAAQYPINSAFCASGPTAIVDVTNPTTGKIWMDRNLGASQAATSSTDTAAYGDLYQWGRGNDGHQCRNSSTTSTLSSTDQPANGSFITASPPNYDWRSPQNNNLWQGVNGVNNPCPSGYRLPTETELNAEITSWSQNNSEGAFSSPLKFTKGGNRDGDVVDDVGTIGRYSSSTVDSTISKYLLIGGSAFMSNTLRAFGISVRCIKDASAIPPTVGALNCGSTSITGTLTNGIVASGVSAEVPYTGGNGGSYATQSISSTGVTGLTALLTSGTLAYGSGSFSFAISGTPSASGTASFALTIGGQSCSFTVTVQSALAAQYPAGSVFCNGPTAIVDVINPTTGKIWMDRNLGASQVATSSTDTAAYGDLYQWGRGNDGHQCRTSATTTSLSTSNTPGNSLFIINNSVPVDWRSPQNNNLWQGVNGLNNPCPSGYRLPTENELNAERASWNSDNYIGAFSSPLKFTLAGRRRYQDGALYDIGTWGNVWTSTVDANGLSRGSNYYSSASGMFMGGRATGYSVRCIKDVSAIPATVGALNCGSTSIIGTLTSGTAASGVSVAVPYNGGNGGSYLAQSISSTGVTSLTATLTSGILANGAGSLSLAISGTPITSGTANFALNIGGQTCNLTISVASNLAAQYPVGSVFCASGPTAIVDIINPTTGKVWMDRNLGASQAATSSADVSSYGDLYQWGRRSDGHQCRNSDTTTTVSSTDQPANGLFIYACNCDWRFPQNVNLWQGVSGINNPCPQGYRIPTQAEWNTESANWVGMSGAISGTVLKLPMAGYRYNAVSIDMSLGAFWSSTVENSGVSWNLLFSPSNDGANLFFRSLGLSVRCIKN